MTISYNRSFMATMTPQQSADRIKDVVDEILDEVHRLPGDLITWKPADDVWSVLEILCHIDEFVPFWTDEAVKAAPARELRDVERSIRTGVSDASAKLAALRETDLQITAMSHNPRWGTKPAAFVVDDLLVHHVEKHLGQIRRNVAQYNESGKRQQERV